MTQQIIFNGASLIRPTGATRVDTSKFTANAIRGVGRVGIAGHADGGDNTRQCFRTFDQVKAFYRSGDIVDAARILLKPSADSRIPGGVFEMEFYKVNQGSASSSVLTKNTGPEAANVVALLGQNYTVSPGAVLNYQTDNSGGAQVVTFLGTNAVRTGGAVSGLPPTASDTLVLSVNGLADQEFIFAGTESTTQDVVDLINATIQGGYADIDLSSQIELISTQFGTGSKIEIKATSTAGLLTKMGHTIGSTGGSGSGVDLSNLTNAELKTLVDATGHMVVDITADPPTWKSFTVGGAGSLQFVSTTPPGLLTELGLVAATYVGTASGAPTNTVTLTSRQQGAATNAISYVLVDPSPTSQQRKLTITDKSSGIEIIQVSPVFGLDSRITVQYVGAGSAATSTVTATTFSTSVTAGPGGEDLSLSLAVYPTLDELVNAINSTNGGGVYAATVDIVNGGTFQSSDLDWVSGVDIDTSALPFYSSVFDLVDWVNNNSSSLLAAREVTGNEAPNEVLTPVFLTGGLLGTAANSDWTVGALDALSETHVDQIVPLLSEDATALQGTYDYATVSAAFVAHAQELSATKGKSERTCWLGRKGNAAVLSALAKSFNSWDAVVCGGRLKLAQGLSGTLAFLPDWSYACALAGMRAAAPIGEPLTHKFIQQFGVERDYTDSDLEDLILSGVTALSKELSSNTWFVEKGITTYTARDNNALTEESIVSAWKAISYDWRTMLERDFIGTKGVVSRISQMKTASEDKLSQYGPLDRGGNDTLTDGTDDNGAFVPAYSDIVIEMGANNQPSDVVEISASLNFASGINFILTNIFALPATISTTN